MARHVRKGDMVQVITGNDKGKVGEVISVDVIARPHGDVGRVLPNK